MHTATHCIGKAARRNGNNANNQETNNDKRQMKIIIVIIIIISTHTHTHKTGRKMLNKKFLKTLFFALSFFRVTVAIAARLFYFFCNFSHLVCWLLLGCLEFSSRHLFLSFCREQNPFSLSLFISLCVCCIASFANGATCVTTE